MDHFLFLTNDFRNLISTMPICLAPSQPMLKTREQRIPSAEMQVSLSKPNIVISKKSVQFYKIVDIRTTTHSQDMTDKEIANTWYSRGELVSIKTSVSTAVNFMSLGKPTGDDHTTRGLESKTREGTRRRKANKQISVYAVLGEQNLQQYRGINDPEGLRKVYMAHSRRCLSESQALGKADQSEVNLIRKADESEDMERDEHEKRSSQNDTLFLIHFTKKRAVMEEIKQLQILVFPAHFTKKRAVTEEIKQLQIVAFPV